MNIPEYLTNLTEEEVFPQKIFQQWASKNDLSLLGFANSNGVRKPIISDIVSVSMILITTYLVLLFSLIIAVWFGYGTKIVKIAEENIAILFTVGSFMGILHLIFVIEPYISFSKTLRKFCQEKERFQKLCPFLPHDSWKNIQIIFERTQVSIAQQKFLIQKAQKELFSESEQSKLAEATCHRKMQELDELAHSFGLQLHDWQVYFQRAAEELK